jgi:hypothetical protein
MRTLVVFLLLAGCVTQEEDDRICLDYDSIQYQMEECEPLYGQLICYDTIKTRVFCTLYQEDN